MVDSIPCKGFVWFRWLRPSKRHDWEPTHVIIFPGLKGIRIPTKHLDEYLHAKPPAPGSHWRRTLDYCNNCDAARLGRWEVPRLRL